MQLSPSSHRPRAPEPRGTPDCPGLELLIVALHVDFVRSNELAAESTLPRPFRASPAISRAPASAAAAAARPSADSESLPVNLAGVRPAEPGALASS